MTAFYFIRWIIAGEAPRGSQTFAHRDSAIKYARRARLDHPEWGDQIVRHADGEQTVVEGTR